jgi:hypothetical protein
MIAQPSAQTAESTDCDLARIEIPAVPPLWPPLDPAEASALPVPGAGAGIREQAPAAEEAWSRQFAVLLAEAMTGVRPVQQIQPWLSKRGQAQLHRLLPLLRAEHRPRVLRVLTTMPRPDVIEMTMVVLIGARARALAVRLERGGASAAAAPRGTPAERWLCTDIEAG